MTAPKKSEKARDTAAGGRPPVLCEADSAPNAYALLCIWFMIAGIAVFLLLQLAHIDIVDNTIALPGLAGALCFLAAAEVFGLAVDHRRPCLKYVLILLSVLAVTVAGVFLTYHTILASVFPLLIAAQYTHKRLVLFSFVLSVVSVFLIVILGYAFGLCDANMVLETVSGIATYHGVLNAAIPTLGERLPTLLLFFALPRCLIIAALVPMINALADSRNKLLLRELEIKYLGEHDYLTGFYNRDKYVTMARDLYGTLPRIAVVYFDVNNLKDINDAFGHDNGDKLLMHAAASISGALSGGMDAYRLGGDEFVVVIPGAGADGAVAFIEKWKRKLDELNSLDPDFACVIACGYAVGAGADLSAVVHLADRNMYVNKGKSKAGKEL